MTTALGQWKTQSIVPRYAHLSQGHRRQPINRPGALALAAPQPVKVAGGSSTGSTT